MVFNLKSGILRFKRYLNFFGWCPQIKKKVILFLFSLRKIQLFNYIVLTIKIENSFTDSRCLVLHDRIYLFLVHNWC